MRRFLQNKRVTQVAVLILVFSVCSILTSIIFTKVQRQLDVPTPDVRDIEPTLIDGADVLGPEWQINLGEGGVPSIQDLQDEYIGVKGAIDRFTRNTTKKSVFIHQHVTQYVDKEVAYNRYQLQENWIFSASVFTHISTDARLSDFIDNIELHADDYHLSYAYMDNESTRCVVLLLYGDTVVYVNMWSEWDSIVYLSGNDIASFLMAIDERMIMVNQQKTQSQ